MGKSSIYAIKSNDLYDVLGMVEQRRADTVTVYLGVALITSAT